MTMKIPGIQPARARCYFN